MGGTVARSAAPWLGSTMIGRCDNACHGRHRRQVQGVARAGLEGADAALAQDHGVAAVRQQVFGRHQQIVHGGADPALEQHRLAHAADPSQQVEVLHVARADLDHVGQLGQLVQMVERRRVRHDRQRVAVAGFAQMAQTGHAEPRKRIGGAVRGERRAAQHHPARFGHQRRALQDLFAALHRRRTGDHGDALPADADRADRHHRVGALQFARGQLVRLGDAQHLVDAVHRLERPRIGHLRSDRAQHGAFAVLDLPHRVAAPLELAAYRRLARRGDAEAQNHHHAAVTMQRAP